MDVDEGGTEREHGADQQADRDRDLEAGVLLREEDTCGPDGVQPHEAAGGHEREREQEDAGIAPPVGSLSGRVSQDEGQGAHGSEDHEVGAVVLEVRVELRPQQQGDEPDERQCGRGDPEQENCRRTRSLTPTDRFGHLFKLGVTAD